MIPHISKTTFKLLFSSEIQKQFNNEISFVICIYFKALFFVKRKNAFMCLPMNA